MQLAVVETVIIIENVKLFVCDVGQVVPAEIIHCCLLFEMALFGLLLT